MSRSCGRPADEIWAIGNSGDTIASATGAPALSSMAPTVAVTRPRDCSLRIARRWWRRRDARHASDSLVRVVDWRNGPTLARPKAVGDDPIHVATCGGSVWDLRRYRKDRTAHRLREPALNKLGPKALVSHVVLGGLLLAYIYM